MCVIVYQTIKQEELSYDEFRAMARQNPDGMGYMALIGDKVVYHKGYFDVYRFYNDYLELRRTDGFKEIALHFRIGTGSEIDKANCHPFPISANKRRIKSENGSADVCVMMNGIIGRSTKEFSDTALYVMSNLKDYYDYDRRFWLHFTQRDKMLFENEINGTRWVFMSREGSKLFGNGWSSYNGKCEVSNRYWISKLKTKNENEYYYSCTTPQRPNKDENKVYKSYIDYLMDGIVG